MRSSILDSLQLTRIENPEKAVGLAMTAVHEVILEELPFVYGEWGSAYRLLGRLEDARFLLELAEELAEKQQNRSARGDLKRRLAYLEASMGDLDLALQHAREAEHIYVLEANPHLIGCALADQTAFLPRLGRYSEAIEVGTAAMKHLSEKQPIEAYSVLMNSAYSFQELGDHLKTAELASKAKKIEGIPLSMKIKAQWIAGEGLLKKGFPQTAADNFREVVDFYLSRSEVYNAALVTCLLVQALVELGELDEAQEKARAMAAFIEPMKGNKIGQSAIVQLVRTSLEARSIKILEQASITASELRRGAASTQVSAEAG